MASLTEREKVIAENMIRKSLLIKVGFNDPSIVKNEH
jgi:Mn-dependent DtxR family transcriptional regulator